MLKWLINKYWNWRYPEWTDQQVQEYFAQFKSITDLRQDLVNKDFKWSSDGLNFSKSFDTFERPNQVLARQWANCGGFMRLFEAYIKSGNDNSIKSYSQFELINDYKWHYVMTITKKDGEIFTQSNLTFLSNYALDICFPNYRVNKIIDSWINKD